MPEVHGSWMVCQCVDNDQTAVLRRCLPDEEKVPAAFGRISKAAAGFLQCWNVCRRFLCTHLLITEVKAHEKIDRILETLEVLMDADTLKRLKKGEEELKAGDYVDAEAEGLEKILG